MKYLALIFAVTACLTTHAFAEEVSYAPSNCEKGYCTGITCEKGMCGEWEGSYEIIPATGTASGASLANFFFHNNTGKTAFNIKILVNFYDSMDQFISRLNFKEEGPIDHFINEPKKALPYNAAKITFDIYWSDQYIPQGQIGG